MSIAVGAPAPDFSSLDQDGVVRTLKDFAGSWLLLYFYPMDDTPGCTVEACGLRDHFAELQKRVTVVGVSADSVESHAAFRAKYQLPFTLLADTDRSVIQAYGADGLLFPKRTSFLVDGQGMVRKVYASVVPEEHAKEILRDVSEMQD